MKHEHNSIRTLHYTQAISKFIEFGLQKDDIRKVESHFSNKPEDLFYIAIASLGDYLNYEHYKYQPLIEKDQLLSELRFASDFFDNYLNTNRINSSDDYVNLLGAVCFYLCNRQGSCSVLVNKLNINTIDVGANNLEVLLLNVLLPTPLSKINLGDSIYSYKIQNINNHFLDFFIRGKSTNILDEIDALCSLSYNFGCDRDIFISEILYSVIKKKIENSVWTKLPNYSNLEKSDWESYFLKSDSIRELWSAQILIGKKDALRGKSCVIQLPTSAGKTKSTELIIRSSFLSKRSDLAVIVAPFRALCHEIKNDYEVFFKNENIAIDEINDIYDENDVSHFNVNQSDSKKIVILTPEKLYFLIQISPQFLSKIGLIIFDEGHQFDTGNRGVLYEILLTELKERIPNSVQKVFISAVIGNSKSISVWLNENENVISGESILPTKRNIGFFNTNQIEFYDYEKLGSLSSFFIPNVIKRVKFPKNNRQRKEYFFPNEDKSSEVAYYLATKLCKNDPVAVFFGSKRNLYGSLKSVCNLYKHAPNYDNPSIYSDKAENKKLCYILEQNFGKDSLSFFCGKYGVFYHDADVPQGIRLSIQEALLLKKINVIFCTSTLAQGVNLPIKYLLVTNTKQSYYSMKVRDFQNLIGRVGRSGKMTEGNVIFTQNHYRDFKLLESCHIEDCSSSLLCIIKPLSYLNKTFQFKDINVWKKFYLKDISINDAISILISDNCLQDEKIIKQLKNEIQIRQEFIEKIENYFLSLGEQLSQEEIEEFSKKLLCYFLASISEKETLLSIISEVGRKILLSVAPLQRKKYAITMQGTEKAKLLYDFCNDNIETLVSFENTTDLVHAFLPIFQNGSFFKKIKSYNFKDIELEKLMLAWINDYYALKDLLIRNFCILNSH